MLASENDVQKIDAPEDAFAMCSAASLSTCRASRCGERGLNDSRLQCRGSGISREDKTDARFSRRLIWLRLGTSGRIAPTVGWFALHPMATVWRACASPRPAAAPSRVSTREHSRRRAPRRLATRAAAAEARPSHLDGRRLGRRDASALLASIAASAPGVPPALAALNEPVVTHRVYFDVGLCPSIVRADRALGSKGGLCEDPEDLGRVVIGLYGELVPNVVERFLALVNAPPGEGYAGTVFHRIKPGAYVLAGQAGSYRMGQVQARRSPPNPELLDGASFRERHLRPGTVSLALGAATGDGDAVGAERSSAQTEFLHHHGAGAGTIPGRRERRVRTRPERLGDGDQSRGDAHVQTVEQLRRVEPSGGVGGGRSGGQGAAELEQAHASHRHHAHGRDVVIR